MKMAIRTAGVLMALAACSTGPQVRYTCGNAAVTAEFSGQDRATITVDSVAHGVTRALSASGARYEGGAGDSYVEFWEHQGTARLTVGRTAYPECHPAPMGR